MCHTNKDESLVWGRLPYQQKSSVMVVERTMVGFAKCLGE